MCSYCELELVRLAAAELLEVGDAEVRRPGGEGVGEGERADRRVAAGTPAGDDEPLGIGLALLDEVARRVDAVVEVDDPPLPVQPLAVRAPVPRRAAVVDVHDGEAATRPELGAEAEDRRRAPCRPAVALDDERRTLSVRCLEVRVRGRIEERVRGQAALRRELDRSAEPRRYSAGERDLELERSVSVVPDATSTRTTALGDVVRPRDDDGPRPSVQSEPRERVQPEVEIVELAGLGVEDREVREPARRRTRRRSGRRRGTRTSALRTTRRDSRTRPQPRGARSRRPSRMRSRFHHPLRSLAKTRSPPGLHSGCQIDSRPSTPATCSTSPTSPSDARSATWSSQPSHGIQGRSQARKQSRVPSGEMRGVE